MGRDPAPHVLDVPRHARLGLKPRRQRIPHAGHEQAGRPLGDDLRIDQHQIGVLAVEAVLVKNALLGVDDRKGAARGVAGGHGRAIHHGQVEVGRRCSCGVQHLAAAGPDDHLGLVLAGGGLHPLDLGQGTLAAEGMDGVFNPGPAEGRLPRRGQQPTGRAPGDETPAPAGPGRAFRFPARPWRSCLGCSGSESRRRKAWRRVPCNRPSVGRTTPPEQHTARPGFRKGPTPGSPSRPPSWHSKRWAGSSHRTKHRPVHPPTEFLK